MELRELLTPPEAACRAVRRIYQNDGIIRGEGGDDQFYWLREPLFVHPRPQADLSINTSPEAK